MIGDTGDGIVVGFHSGAEHGGDKGVLGGDDEVVGAKPLFPEPDGSVEQPSFGGDRVLETGSDAGKEGACVDGDVVDEGVCLGGYTLDHMGDQRGKRVAEIKVKGEGDSSVRLGRREGEERGCNKPGEKGALVSQRLLDHGEELAAPHDPVTRERKAGDANGASGSQRICVFPERGLDTLVVHERSDVEVHAQGA